ncbi:MAG: ParA family protein [Schwartzia sp.]|nr:ParA family protein [Schwartzia sp. (in: firmicutes)]
MKVIARANRKGGVGKTTTALAVSAYLGRKFSVLSIDIDGQGNFSQASGGQAGHDGTFEFLSGEPLETIVQHYGKKPNFHYDFLSADARLNQVPQQFAQFGQGFLLRDALARVKKSKKYDFIILDTSPSMNDLTLNAFIAADAIVICCQINQFNLDGLEVLKNNLLRVKQFFNKELSVAGILFTCYDSRLKISNALETKFNEYAEELGSRIFTTRIRNNITIQMAQMEHCDIFSHDSKCNGAIDYANFTKELFTTVEGDKKKWPKDPPMMSNGGTISIPRTTRRRPTRHPSR